MKASLLLCLALLSASILSAQTPVAPAAPIPTPMSRIMTEDNFRAFLIGTTWKWAGRNGDAETVTFFADGTLRNSWGWVAKFVVKGMTEIELRKEGQTAKLTFDKTYTHYDGIDFDKTWPLKGQREK